MKKLFYLLVGSILFFSSCGSDGSSEMDGDSDNGNWATSLKLDKSHKHIVKQGVHGWIYITLSYDKNGLLKYVRDTDTYEDREYCDITWGEISNTQTSNSNKYYIGDLSLPSYIAFSDKSIPLKNAYCDDGYQKNNYVFEYDTSGHLIYSRCTGSRNHVLGLKWDGDMLTRINYDGKTVCQYTYSMNRTCKGHFYFPEILSFLWNGDNIFFYLYMAHPEILGLRTNVIPDEFTSCEFTSDGYLNYYKDEEEEIPDMVQLEWE